MLACCHTKAKPKDLKGEKRMKLSKYNAHAFDRGRSRLVEIIWIILQGLFVGTWAPGVGLRIFLLRRFGACIGKGVVLKPRLRVKFPWKLVIGDHVWLGEDVWIDNLEYVNIANNVCISQGVYICTGNHDWTKQTFDLIVKPVTIEAGVWVGAKAVICPGVTLKNHAITCAGAVVVKSTDSYTIYSGNPATEVKKRVYN